MTNKNNIVADLLSTDEGRQRLAHAMIGSKTPFECVPSPEGSEERAYANYMRHMAEQPGTSSGIAQFYTHMAESWEEYARVPKWKKRLIEFLNKILGAR